VRKKAIIYCVKAAFLLSALEYAHAQQSDKSTQAFPSELSALPQIASCDYSAVAKLKFYGVSIGEATEACAILANRLHRTPSNRLLDYFAKLIFIQHAAGNKDSAKEISYQAANFIEYRGHLENDDKAINSLNVLVKILNGLEGRVSISDMNRALYGMGQSAKKMTDDSIFTLAAMIMQEKRSQGK